MIIVIYHTSWPHFGDKLAFQYWSLRWHEVAKILEVQVTGDEIGDESDDDGDESGDDISLEKSV